MTNKLPSASLFLKNILLYFISLIRNMKLNTKDPMIIAKIILFILIAILSYIILYYAYKGFNQCDNICRLDRTVSENTGSNNIGLSFASLSLSDEREIKNAIEKTLKSQWNYFYNKDENQLDESIKNYYIYENYDSFKKELKEYFKDVTQNGVGNIGSLNENIKFSKLRKYSNLDNRIGVIIESFNYQYFLFKKVNNQWKIEKERIAFTKYSELPAAETNIIKEILEKDKN